MLKRKQNFVVLKKGSYGGWHEFTASYAHSRKAAVDQALAGTNMTGEFKAVPIPMWKTESR